MSEPKNPDNPTEASEETMTEGPTLILETAHYPSRCESIRLEALKLAVYTDRGTGAAHERTQPDKVLGMAKEYTTFIMDDPLTPAQQVKHADDIPQPPEGSIYAPYQNPSAVGWAGWYDDANGNVLGWKRLDGSYFPRPDGMDLEVLDGNEPSTPKVTE